MPPDDQNPDHSFESLRQGAQGKGEGCWRWATKISARVFWNYSPNDSNLRVSVMFWHIWNWDWFQPLSELKIKLHLWVCIWSDTARPRHTHKCAHTHTHTQIPCRLNSFIFCFHHKIKYNECFFKVINIYTVPLTICSKVFYHSHKKKKKKSCPL